MGRQQQQQQQRAWPPGSDRPLKGGPHPALPGFRLHYAVWLLLSRPLSQSSPHFLSLACWWVVQCSVARIAVSCLTLAFVKVDRAVVASLCRTGSGQPLLASPPRPRRLLGAPSSILASFRWYLAVQVVAATTWSVWAGVLLQTGLQCRTMSPRMHPHRCPLLTMPASPPSIATANAQLGCPHLPQGRAS